MSRPRRPAVTEAVLSALVTCLVHAESVVHADQDTHGEDMPKLERAEKWLKDMRQWRVARRGAVVVLTGGDK